MRQLIATATYPLALVVCGNLLIPSQDDSPSPTTKTSNSATVRHDGEGSYQPHRPYHNAMAYIRARWRQCRHATLLRHRTTQSPTKTAAVMRAICNATSQEPTNFWSPRLSCCRRVRSVCSLPDRSCKAKIVQANIRQRGVTKFDDGSSKFRSSAPSTPRQTKCVKAKGQAPSTALKLLSRPAINVVSETQCYIGVQDAINDATHNPQE